MFETLHYSKLRRCYKSKLESLIKDEDLPVNIELLQKRAINSLKFGLNIKNESYNIYLSGESGLGKTFFARKYAQSVSENETELFDFVYVYNFKNPKNPKLLTFDSGGGKVFKSEIEHLINCINVKTSEKFNSKEFTLEKDEIINHYESLQDKYLNNIRETSLEKGLQLKSGKSSFYFIPIDEENVNSEDDFLNLSYEKKEKYNLIIKEIQNLTFEDATKIKELENELKDKIKALEFNNFLFIVGYYVGVLQNKYSQNPHILEYLKDLKEDIILNRDAFIELDTEDEEILNLMSFQNVEPKENIFDKYTVNLFLDNSDNMFAPVILEHKPNYNNLFGFIELDSDNLAYNEHMKIKAGTLHKANNGYVIINVKDLLTYPNSFESLMNFLETGKVEIETFKESVYNYLPMTYIKPESANIKVKIILIGSEYEYDILAQYPMFLKFFKVNAVFDQEVEVSEQSIFCLVKFIKEICDEKNLLELDIEALNLVLQNLNKIAETQNKFYINIDYLTEILIESNYFAKNSESDYITYENVKNTIENKIYFNNMYEQKLNNMILENDIIIETSGSFVGQVNGLAVLDYGDYSFGKPIKITATTYIGEDGIINIEKEANISGNIHNKGVQVLCGYLGQKYAQSFPLSLTCNICIEQNYSGVDGDSCISTELYAILSSLSGVPITQEIAVTGSINQKGEIQPVGSVTEKIEGFFEICNKRGLTGQQAVIIPYQNAKDLCLNDEVISAVKDGKFNIYTVENVDQGIEILTGVFAGEINENGEYPENSIHFKAFNKLKGFFENLN